MEIVGLPSIPDYFKSYVDDNTDLNITPHIPCPFHNETTGQSFSYSSERNIWRCFGACHCGGDVVDLHRLNYKLRNRNEAEKSLCRLLGVSFVKKPVFKVESVEIDEEDVHRRSVYVNALNVARTPDDWVELDYILSKVPYDVAELELFCKSRGTVPLIT